jgi:hypothetical protein
VPVSRFATVVDALHQYPDGAVLQWTASSHDNTLTIAVENGPCAALPWCWRVYSILPSGSYDALHLEVPLDLVFLVVTNTDTAARFIVCAPFENRTDTLPIAADALPQHPWAVTAEAGWSAPAVASALQAWVSSAGRPDLRVAQPELPETLNVGDGVAASPAALDALLDNGAEHAPEVNDMLMRLARALREATG